MTKKNKLCYKEVKDHNILNTYYNAISNLFLLILNTYLIFLIKLKIHARDMNLPVPNF